METRSKVAAAIAAVVPFHCMICFEEFSEVDRPPVVLPCGHTYVCMQCSKRLKRCMECREPLFMHVSKTSHANTRSVPAQPISLYQQRLNGVGRFSPTPPMTPPQRQSAATSQGSPSSAPTVPLPIPKNLVLLSMMEAASRQTNADDSGDAQQHCSELQTLAVDDEESYDLNRIITGLATMTGPCGTYVVKEPGGLVVLSQHPHKRTDLEEKKSDGIEVLLSGDKDIPREPFLVHKGQKIQVVDFEDGIAKLARGAGYIVASTSQLVKVQGPLEKCCRLEGLLDTVVSRRQDLERELEESKRIEASLTREIDLTSREAPNHPVITDPLPKDDFEIHQDHSKDHGDYGPHPSTPTSDTRRGENSQPLQEATYDYETRNFLISRGSSDREPVKQANSPYPRSPNSIDNSDLNGPGLPRYRRTSPSDDLHSLEFGCVTDLFADSVRLFGSSNNSESEEVLPGFSLTSETHSRARSIVSSIMGASPSFDGVDFRTGMSGHRGLNNARRGLNSKRRGERRMMSEHRGAIP